jgi:cyclase
MDIVAPDAHLPAGLKARRAVCAPVLIGAAIALLAPAILVPRPISAQEDATPRFRSEALSANLRLLRGRGGNVVACTGPQGVFLVDTDYEQLAPDLLAAIARLGAGPARLVVDTHWHFDHVGGNGALIEAGAIIAAHPNTRRYMVEGGPLEVIDREVEPAASSLLPAVMIADSLTLHWGAETIRVLHLGPGHTGGDLVVRFHQADVVHAGDLFFNFGYPYIDTAHGGGIDQLLATVQVVLSLCGPQTRIVPGHGPVGTPEELARYRDVLQEFRDLVAAEMEKGLSLQEIIAAQPTRALDQQYGDRMFPPAEFTEMVWLSLGGEPR